MSHSPNQTPSVFFYCYPPTQRGEGSYHTAWHYYQHAVVVLAEGLQELGIPCYSNINYWKLSPHQEQYLLQPDPHVNASDCSIVIFNDHRCLLQDGSFRKDIFNPSRSCVTVYLDITDEDHRPIIFYEQFRQFNLILKAHYSNYAWYPKNVRPWFFGLSHRILQELKVVPKFEDRQTCLLYNFRHSKHPHTLRKFIHNHYIPKIRTILSVNSTTDRAFDPLEQSSDFDDYHLMQYAQSSSRHNPYYYQRLRQSTASTCFGGFFTTTYPRNQATLLSRNLRRVFTTLNLRSHRILQWDSWRFWESLAAGCVPFHVDFEKYGFHLPVMPQNWQHYVGVDLDRLDQSVERLRDEPEILASISHQARQWALEHYTPRSVALKFLSLASPTYSPQTINYVAQSI